MNYTPLDKERLAMIYLLKEDRVSLIVGITVINIIILLLIIIFKII